MTDSPNNTIGGSAPGAGNVIFGRDGILINGPTAHGNVIQGKLIGTNAAGTSALGCSRYGILIDHSASTTIGGTEPGEGNLISGNALAGIAIDNSTNTLILGNSVGLNGSGTDTIPNRGPGISLANMNTSNTHIGGGSPGSRNVISGNGGGGIVATLCDRMFIQGNFIGTNALGTLPLGNKGAGVTIGYNCRPSLIGGTTPDERNVISGNTGYGIIFAIRHTD